MSVNKVPALDEMLALLERLRRAVKEFGTREEQLNAEVRTKLAAANKAFETAKAEQSTNAAESIQQADALFEERRARWLDRSEKRKSRINRAHMDSRRRALDAIRDQEGRRKYKVQEGTLNAERKRDAELAASAQRREQFHGELAEANQRLEDLERRAARAFRGYPGLRRLLIPAEANPGAETSATPDSLLTQFRSAIDDLEKRVATFSGTFPIAVAAHLPLWLAVLLIVAGAVCLVPAIQQALSVEFPWRALGLGSIGAGVVLGLIRIWGWSRARGLAPGIADEIHRARRQHDAAFQQAEARFGQEQQRAHAEFDSTARTLDREWKQAVKEALQGMDQRPRQIDAQAKRAMERSEQFRAARLAQIEREHDEAVRAAREQAEEQARVLSETHARQVQQMQTEHKVKLDALTIEWRQEVDSIYSNIREAKETAATLFPEWQLERWTNWSPPDAFLNAAKLGSIEVDLSKFLDPLPKGATLTLPDPALSLPLLLTYPERGSVLFETKDAGAQEAIGAINNIIFRILSAMPPGRFTFTIFDPVGLGQNFAGLMHLADYEESHINSRIWTQTSQLEEKLGELNEHMEKVIQMYLRNEFETIAEYNAQAGSIAEKYHFLVIADFPANFSDTAARRLINIMTSGARCGVYTFIQWDRRQALPTSVDPEDLKKNSIHLVWAEGGFQIEGKHPRGARIHLEPPPAPEFATAFLRRIGETGKDASRVEVPFEHVAPSPDEVWSLDTTEELRVPIGRTGATKFQYLEIGRGTRQHALIAGKTGSGKSTLFHVIVTNLALWCSPEQVEFYLVDFKKGVEFKGYATRRLPHARVVAIESDRDFGLSVLQRVDEELRRRGDLFRKAGVQDLSGYKRSKGAEPMPRSLLIIDEFQEFFTEEDRVSQGAAVLLDRIVRQGRAFGIHVLLGSQTLGGAYTLARATIGQMVIRIALQCNEADAYLIMDQDNPAPRLLSRPGEGIYNDAAGAIEGNSPFQTVWLPEEERDRQLQRVRAVAEARETVYPGPFVFEGNAPADIRENVPLATLLRSEASQSPVVARVWLGAPNAVKGPTEAVFQRQSGSNLLIVGQSDEPTLALISVALVALSAQYPKGGARFVILDSTTQGLPQRTYLERVVRALPHEIALVKPGEIGDAMSGLANEIRERAGDEDPAARPAVFLVVNGVQNFKRLRQEDEFGFGSDDAAASPAAAFLNVLTDGSARGVFTIATFDSYNNVNRFLGRKNLNEFEMRVLFQMSATDSASLIDDPAASTLGLHRALYYNHREGYLETFRPYALPAGDWIEQVEASLGERKGVESA